MASVVKITENNFEQEVINESKLTIVKFGAAWCGPCKKMDPIIDALADEDPEVKVTSVDIDHNRALAAKYAILSVPYTLFFKGGKVMESVVGLVPKGKLVEIVARNK